MELAPLLQPLQGHEMVFGGSGADIGPLVREGVVGLGMAHDPSEYWRIHHTHADTFEKIIKEDLDKNVAIMAVLVYALAEMPDRLLAAPPATP